VTPCGDMRQSFTDALVNWFFDNFPVFAGSFVLVSIHCVGRGLGTSFVYMSSYDSTAFLLYYA